MSRSVSYPSDAIVAYRDITDIEEDYDFDWYIDDLRDQVKEVFPSMEVCNKWLDREDHAIAENRFAYFGISTYCGLASVWMVKKEFDTYYEDENRLANMADNWMNLIYKKFNKVFGEYRKIGTASNGESFFEKI